MELRDGRGAPLAIPRSSRSRRDLGAQAGALASLPLISACALGASGGAAAPPAGLKTGAVLTNMVWGDTPPDPDRVFAGQRFTELNPGVKVDVVSMTGNAEFDAKVVAMIAGGTPPDVIQVGGRNFGMYAARGVALDLAPYVRRDRDNLDDFLPVTVEFSKWQDKLFSLPNDFNCLGIYYNLEHFEAAGVRPPPADWKAPGWTWQDFVDAGLRLTRRDSMRFGLAAIPSALTNSAPWVWAAGGEILSKDGTKVLLDQAPAVEAFQFLQDLRQKHRLIPEMGETGGVTGNNIFFNGFAAMNIAGAAFTAMARRMIQGFRWNVCPFPAGRAGRFSATGGTQGSSWLIPAATASKNEAWAFTRFLSGEEMQQRITKSGLIGARKSAAATARQLNGGQPPPDWGMFLDGVPLTRAVPHVARWMDFDTVYGTEVGKVIAGQAAPRETGARLKEQLEPLLVAS